jgi:hypothetical protein
MGRSPEAHDDRDRKRRETKRCEADGGGAQWRLRMPLGQRTAHVPPKRCLSISDLLGQAFVDAGDGRFELEAGVNGGTASTLAGHVSEDEPKGTQTVAQA